MRELRLIRHGAVVDDGGRRYVGRTDLAMSAEGEAQIRATARALRRLPPPDVVLCSTLARSRRTAEILADGGDVAIVSTSRLDEIDMGSWEGIARSDMATRDPAAHAARGRDLFRFRPPGGESFADVVERLEPLWRDLEADDRIVTVAGHAGVNRLWLCRLLGRPFAEMFEIAQHPGCIDLVEWQGGAPRVRLLDGRPAALDLLCG